MLKPYSKDIFDEKDFPISQIRQGVLAGTGVDTDEVKEKPIIAVANSQTEFNPGHMHLNNLAVRVKEGIHAAGGIPFEFNVPAPCDGIAEGHSGMKFILPQRDLIADMVETHIRSMRFDGVVMIASCDKIIPGMLMATARLDLPTVFLTGGPSELVVRQRSTKVQSINMKDHTDARAQAGCMASGSCGACEIMGTANTFQCIAEALGLALPGSAVVPGYTAEKNRIARKCGMTIVDLVAKNLTARQILSQKALENALMISQAIGGSTNVALHLPALAHELDLDLPLTVFNKFSKKVPTICSIAPNGPYGVQDLYRAGGVPAVMSRIIQDLHLDCHTISGKTIREIADKVEVFDEKVIPDRLSPHFSEGGTVALFGNLAPEGAVIKQSAVDSDMLSFSGPARVFESEEACLDALREKLIQEGEVLIIRNEGPKGGPGMPETLAVTIAISMSGMKKIALITDGRFSGASSGPCIGHVSPEAAAGGPIAVIKDGDEIEIDIPKRKLELKLSDETIKKRLQSWQPSQAEIPKGYMRRYVKYVTSAAKGAYVE
jgi:dihydroxy-acid dehydratase